MEKKEPDIAVVMNSEERHATIVEHLRKSRDFGKYVLKMGTEKCSVLISHQVEIRTVVGITETLVTKIDLLPVTRMYRTGNNKIVNDDDLLKEMEEGKWD